MPGNPHPARPPFEAHDDEDLIAMEKEHYSLVLADAAEVNNSDLSGQVAGIYVRANASDYLYDPSSVAADDGLEVIIDAAGNHFTRIASGSGPGTGDAPLPSGSVPPMDATPGSAGGSLAYARGDHRHPSDTSRLPLTGGTLTGALILAADPLVALGAATRQYVDGLTGADGIKTIAVTGSSPVIADTPTDTVTFVGAGTVAISTDPATDTITFTGSGGTGTGVTDGDKVDIVVSTTTTPGDTWTIDNKAVSNAKLADMAEARFKGRASGSGSGVPVDLDATQALAILGIGSAFSIIAVSGQGNVLADNPSDTLTFEAGPNITIETTPGTDTVRISASGTPGATLADGDYGDIIVSGGGTAINIQSTADVASGSVGVVSNSKLVAMPGGTVKANITGGSAQPSDVTLTNFKTWMSLQNVDNTSDATKNDATATLKNKTLDNTNTITVKDNNFTLQDDADVTKQARFQLSGIATGTMRTFILPNVDSTIVTVASFGTNVAAFLASPTSANLAAALTDETGTAGKVVFDTSPVLVTPNLGTPSALVLTSATGLPTAGLVDKAVTYVKMQDVTATARVLGRKAAGAGVVEELQGSDVKAMMGWSQTDINGLTTTDSPQFAGVNVGHASNTTITQHAAGVIAVEGLPLFSGIPVQNKSADYTLALTDAQQCIHHPSTDAANRTFTIPANTSVAFPIGTCITFDNDVNTITIAITTDTMILASTNAGGAGVSRTLAAGGIATALKTEATKWKISGAGLT